MCFSCYEEYGSPRVVTTDTIAAAELVRRVYKHSSVGGNLHAQFDDWNLEDEFFLAFEIWRNVTPAQQHAERLAFAAFRALDVAGRASALAIYEGWLER